MSSSRKLTNPLRPAARYRKGQAPAGAPLSDSDSDSDNDQPDTDAQHPQGNEAISEGDEQEEEDVKPRLSQAQRKAGAGAGGAMKVSLREVEVDHQGQVRVGGRTEVGRTAEESSEGEYETDEEDKQAGPRAAGAGARGAQDEVSRASSHSHPLSALTRGKADWGVEMGRARASTRPTRTRRRRLSRFISPSLSPSQSAAFPTESPLAGERC